MLAQLKQRFQQLNSREQQLVLVASIFITLFIFYSLIWQPLNNGLDKAQKGVVAQKETLQWLQQNIAKVKLLQAGNSNKSFSGSLTQLVNNSARQHKLVIARMQPGNKNLQLWLEDAPFNDLLKWLNYLTQQGVKVENLDIATANKPGVVKIRRLQLTQ